MRRKKWLWQQPQFLVVMKGLSLCLLLFLLFAAGKSQAAEEVNIALATNGGTVTSSGDYNAYTSERAIDGIDNTHGWISDRNSNISIDNPVWLKLQFAAKKRLTRIKITSHTGYQIRDFTVEYGFMTLAGETWRMVPGGTFKGQTANITEINLPANSRIIADRLRITITGVQIDHARIWEVEVYADPADILPLAGSAVLTCNPLRLGDSTRGETQVEFSLSEEAQVTLQVFAIDGRLVYTFCENESFPEGEHTTSPWDGRVNGRPIPRGDYLLYFLAQTEDERNVCVQKVLGIW